MKSKIHQSNGIITAKVEMPADCIWFEGHFPGEAILPGVAQLALVVQILSDTLQMPLCATSVNRVRFKQAIRPAESFEVQMTPKADNKLEWGFRLSKGSELVCSGSLKLKIWS